MLSVEMYWLFPFIPSPLVSCRLISPIMAKFVVIFISLLLIVRAMDIDMECKVCEESPFCECHEKKNEVGECRCHLRPEAINLAMDQANNPQRYTSAPPTSDIDHDSDDEHDEL